MDVVSLLRPLTTKQISSKVKKAVFEKKKAEEKLPPIDGSASLF